MKRSHLFLLALATLSTGALASIPSPSPVYSEGGQYTAVLQQGAGHWRLTPVHGQDLLIHADEADCGSDNPALPSGLWMLVRESDGSAALLAPSVTALPAGHPERVALRDCEAVDEPGLALNLPRPLLEWIAQSSGAVLLTD
jgi:hypothetical protein